MSNPQFITVARRIRNIVTTSTREPGLQIHLAQGGSKSELHRVINALDALSWIAENNRLPQNMTDLEIITILTAIVWIPVRPQSTHLYEFDVAKIISNQPNAVQKTATWIDQQLNAGVSFCQNDQEGLERVVAFHKIADRVVYGRLNEQVFKYVFDLCKKEHRILGVVSACFLAAGGDQGVAKKLTHDRMLEIIKSWADSNSYKSTNICEDVDVLYDYALCTGTSQPILHAEYSINNIAMQNFAKAYNEWRKKDKTSTPWFIKDGNQFVTIDYWQSKHLFESQLRQRLRNNDDILEKGEFSQIITRDVPESLGFPNDQVTFSAYRIPAHRAFEKITGIRPASGEAVDCLAKLIQEEPADRVSLALAQRCLMAVDLDRFESIVITTHGGLAGSYVPTRWKIPVPPRSDVIDNPAVVRLIERVIAAHAINLGVLGGYDRLQIDYRVNERTSDDAERKRSDWEEHINALFGNPSAGYELMVRYIETYMRSHDVRVSGWWISEDRLWSSFDQAVAAIRKPIEEKNND